MDCAAALRIFPELIDEEAEPSEEQVYGAAGELLVPVRIAEHRQCVGSRSERC